MKCTKPVKFIPTSFVPAEDAKRGARPQKHRDDHPDYPDPVHYLDAWQKYTFRHPDIRHLRFEQYKRYFSAADDHGIADDGIREDTRDAEEAFVGDLVPVQTNHRHYDHMAQCVLPGKSFRSCSPYGEVAVRRKNTSLAVSRSHNPEPLGEQREHFYEKQLLLSLPWYCDGVSTHRDSEGKDVYT